MKRTQTISASSHLMTLTIEHKRIFARLLRKSFSLSYKEFSALLALAQASKKLSMYTLADFLILDHAATSIILIELEERDLVVKTEPDENSSKTLFTASEQGMSLTEEAVIQLDTLLKKTLWTALPVDDFQQIMQNDVKSSVDVLRGYPMDIHPTCISGTACLTIDFLIFWRILVERWASVVKRQTSLSLSEYRILGLLADLGPSTLQKVCDCLVMPRSRVSVYKKNLIERNLLKKENNPEDGRSIILALTPQGEQLVAQMKKSIIKIVDTTRAEESQDNVLVVKAWYAQMYDNLREGEKRGIN